MVEDLKVVPVEKPDAEMHWVTNIISNCKVYKVYRSEKSLLITDRLKEKWFEIIL